MAVQVRAVARGALGPGIVLHELLRVAEPRGEAPHRIGIVGTQPSSSPKAWPLLSEIRQLCSGQVTLSPWTMPWLSGPALCGHLLTSA